MHAAPFAVDAALLAAARAAAAAFQAEVAAYNQILGADAFAPAPAAIPAALAARQDALAALGAHVARSWAALAALDDAAPAAAEGRSPEDAPAPVTAEGRSPEDAPAPAAAEVPLPVDAPAPAAAERPLPVDAPAPVTAEVPLPVAAPAPAPVPPRSPPASPAAIRALGAQWRNGKSTPPAARPADRAAALAIVHAQAIHALGPASAPATPDAAQTALSRVLAVIDARDTWPAELRFDLLAAVVPRLRYFQDEYPLPLGAALLDPAFQRLTEWSARARPGFVWGLARDHRPRNGTWLDEAQAAWDALQAPTDAAADRRRALRAVREAVSSGLVEILVSAIRAATTAGLKPSDPQLLQAIEPAADALLAPDSPADKAVRNALRKWLQEDDTATAAADRDAALDPAVRAWCAGKRVLIIGGEGAAHARKRLRDAFAFADLHWHPAWELSRADSLRTAALDRKHDLVVFIARFSSHALSDKLLPVLRDSGLPLVVIHTGYGVPQVAKAIAAVVLPGAAR